MAVNEVEALIIGSALQINWKLLLPEARALSVQVATDSNFTRNYNHFMIPVTASFVRLDLGVGSWFFRIGTWSGKDHAGDAAWSPTYGPANVVCAKPTLKPPAPNIAILHSFPIPEGIHFNSNISVKNMICVEICKNSSGFEADNTVMRYFLDWGHGGFDVRGLDPLNTFALRITKFPCSDGLAEFPTTELWHMPAGVVIGAKRPIRSPRHLDGSGTATARGGEALLRDAAERRTMKFSSQADYLRFLAAKTKSQFH
jgi:hypothetical protein